MKFLKKKWPVISVIAVILYFVIGLTAPFSRYQEMDSEAVSRTESMFDREAILEGRASVDRAMLVETNTEALEERIRLINLAKDRIILATYDMRSGESTDDIAALLWEKAGQGVQVRILVDGISGAIRMRQGQEFYMLNAHPNIEIKLYNRIQPLLPWKTQGRMHDKYILVDDIGYILGGRNTFDYFIGDYDTANSSFDREVFIYNTKYAETDNQTSSLYMLEAYFEDIWKGELCSAFQPSSSVQKRTDRELLTNQFKNRYENLVKQYPMLFQARPEEYGSMTHETMGVQILSNPTGIYGKEPYVFYQLTELMKASKAPVVIHTPYIVCNAYMYQTLSEVSRTVPSMELLTNSVENGDNFVAIGDYMKNKKKVIATGADIYEYDGGSSYHGKSVVIGSDISVIGSYNFDLRSTYVNTELMAVIKSKALTEELTGYMEAMKENSRHVTDEDSYETPEGWTLPDLPQWKKAAMKIVGYLMQPFRYLI